VNPSRIETFEVHKESTLLPYIMWKMPSLKEKTARRLIANSQVSVGGVPVTLFDYKLYPEDEVVVSRDRIKEGRRHRIKVIYEDDDLIAIDKPSGLLSVATEREKGHTAYRYVSDYVASKDRDARIFVVHRLDEDTSGILVFAKNYETRRALQLHWQSIVFKRYYYAVVEGEDVPESGRLRDYLAVANNTLVYVTKDRRKGKLAVTNYKKIMSGNGLSLLDVSIETGRKNQIRAQLGNIGHYVIGDDKYGEPVNPIHRLGLHAYELAFENPLTKKRYDFKSDMPGEFRKLFVKGGAKKDKTTTERKGGPRDGGSGKKPKQSRRV
jgi:23S rRNA pseudouridine1911/1915/1917 synthase